MTDQEIQQAITYFISIQNSNRVWIEAEMRHKDKIRFDNKYILLTGVSVPVKSDTLPYYVWYPSAAPNSKWGIELRIYYISDDNTPQALLNRSTNNTRHGYSNYNKRINYNKLIWKLFQNGFQLGQN